MDKDKTGVQLNLGHTSTDDFITEKYVLPLLRAVSYTHLRAHET